MSEILTARVKRHYNIAAYENLEIEVSLQFQAGDEPGTVIREITEKLEEANPRCPVEEYELRRAKEILEKELPTKEEVIEEFLGGRGERPDPETGVRWSQLDAAERLDPRYEYDEKLNRYLKKVAERDQEAREVQTRFNKWHAKQKAALEFLNRFAPREKYTDHTLNHTDDY